METLCRTVDELTRLYEDERDREDGKAPLLYKLIKELKNKATMNSSFAKIHELQANGMVYALIMFFFCMLLRIVW